MTDLQKHHFDVLHAAARGEKVQWLRDGYWTDEAGPNGLPNLLLPVACAIVLGLEVRISDRGFEKA